MRRYASRFARIYRVELRLKEAQMILSFGSNKFKVVSSNGLKCPRSPGFFIFELKLKWFVGSRSTKQTTRRYALRFARIHRVELRLKEAQMILSSGSNRLKVVTQSFHCVSQAREEAGEGEGPQAKVLIRFRDSRFCDSCSFVLVPAEKGPV